MDAYPEIEKRKIFAIISHPDTGKTTLTEKLLLFGAGIRVVAELEYGAKCDSKYLNFHKDCRITAKQKGALEAFNSRMNSHLTRDKENHLDYFATSDCELQNAKRDCAEVNFYFTTEFTIIKIICNE